jgi:hypothetical protein
MQPFGRNCTRAVGEDAPGIVCSAHEFLVFHFFSHFDWAPGLSQSMDLLRYKYEVNDFIQGMLEALKC